MNVQRQPEVYDLVILGSGAGSKLLAWTFAGRGQRVAVVERKYVGGAARTSHVCRVKMSFIRRSSPTMFGAARSSESALRASVSICPL